MSAAAQLGAQHTVTDKRTAEELNLWTSSACESDNCTCRSLPRAKGQEPVEAAASVQFVEQSG